YFVGQNIANTHGRSVSVLEHHHMHALDTTFKRARFHWLLGGGLYTKAIDSPRRHAASRCADEITLTCLVSTFGQRLPSVATFGHGIVAFHADEKLDYPLADSHVR